MRLASTHDMDFVNHPCQVTWVPEIGLVSSSVDSTIKIYDFVREKASEFYL